LIVDIASDTTREVGPASACAPVPSPDGRSIAALSGGQVVVIDVMSGDWSAVGFDAGFGCGPYTGWDAPTWSADSERLAYVSAWNGDPDSPPPFDSGRIRSTSITVVRRDGSDPFTVTSSAAAWARPLWSPDGRWIAYRRAEGLGVIRPDGTEAQLLVEGTIDKGRLAWWPDPSRTDFGMAIGDDDYGPTELWTVDIASGVSERVPVGGASVIDFARRP
jgi:hypothetical protein